MEVITEATNACAVREEDKHVYAVTPLKIRFVLNALLERAREKLMEDKKLGGSANLRLSFLLEVSSMENRGLIELSSNIAKPKRLRPRFSMLETSRRKDSLRFADPPSFCLQ
jgi:predicted NACHT family NTPase